MLSPEELGWDLGLVARATLRERFRVTADLARAFLERPGATEVHDLRVSCRRLREGLHLFSAAAHLPALEDVERATRRAMKGLGPLREADVRFARLRTLERKLPQEPEVSKARRLLLRWARAERVDVEAVALDQARRRVGKLIRALRRASPPSLAAPATAAEADVKEREAHVLEFFRWRVAARRAEARRKARPLAAAGSGHGAAALINDELLHEIRVVVKHWRYAHEMARWAVDRLAYRTTAAELRRMQALGGSHRDLSDLVRWIDRNRVHKLQGSGVDRLKKICAAERDATRAEFVQAVRHTLLGRSREAPGRDSKRSSHLS